MADPILIVVQSPRSDPGRIARQLRTLGHALDVRRPSEGDALPASMERHAGAVVFGGPMSANDDATLPAIRAQLDWLPGVVASGKPYLGVCLGGQLLARALGARVAPHPENLVEIGYHPVRPVQDGCAVFPRLHTFYQWHQEGFELPRGAERLATGDVFANQAFRYGNAWAIQFHPEVTGRIMRRWTTAGAQRLSLPGAQAADHQERLRPASEREVRPWLRNFLMVWLGLRPGPARAPRAAAATASSLRESRP